MFAVIHIINNLPVAIYENLIIKPLLVHLDLYMLKFSLKSRWCG